MTGSVYRRLAHRSQIFVASISFEQALAVTCAAHGVDPDLARRALDAAAAGRISHGDPLLKALARARREAVYLAVTHFGLSLRRASAATAMSIEGVRRSIAAVERDRDDKAYDRHLDELELELMGEAAA